MKRPLPAGDPLAALDVVAFVDLVRQLRCEQILDRSCGAPTSPKVQALTEHLDGWLADLGRPPVLPVALDAGDLAGVVAAAADEPDQQEGGDW